MNKNILFSFTLLASLITMGVGCSSSNQASSDFDVPSFITGDFINNDGSSGVAISSNAMIVSAIVKPGVTIVKTKTGTTNVQTKDYGTALGIYGKSGYRFQFSSCSGNPGSLTMKLGTKFMIDNRDDKSHQIAIGSQSYKLGAYDFAIISIKKVGSFNITCDGGGAAQVSVQK